MQSTPYVDRNAANSNRASLAPAVSLSMYVVLRPLSECRKRQSFYIKKTDLVRRCLTFTIGGLSVPERILETRRQIAPGNYHRADGRPLRNVMYSCGHCTTSASTLHLLIATEAPFFLVENECFPGNTEQSPKRPLLEDKYAV